MLFAPGARDLSRHDNTSGIGESRDVTCFLYVVQTDMVMRRFPCIQQSRIVNQTLPERVEVGRKAPSVGHGGRESTNRADPPTKALPHAVVASLPITLIVALGERGGFVLPSSWRPLSRIKPSFLVLFRVHYQRKIESDAPRGDAEVAPRRL